ncbi:ricin-type beta-trefoil lectin domain protein [Actinoplanes sp. CA-054009]
MTNHDRDRAETALVRPFVLRHEAQRGSRPRPVPTSARPIRMRRSTPDAPATPRRHARRGSGRWLAGASVAALVVGAAGAGLGVVLFGALHQSGGVAPVALDDPLPSSPSTSAPAVFVSLNASASAVARVTLPARTKSSSASASPSAPAPVSRTATIVASGGRCLDLNGGVPDDGNHVQVVECNRTGAQIWTLAADGTLRVLGKCAAVWSDATVHIATCKPSSRSQQWHRGSSSAIVNDAKGCLTDPKAGAADFSAVVAAPCAHITGQRWSLR